MPASATSCESHDKVESNRSASALSRFGFDSVEIPPFLATGIRVGDGFGQSGLTSRSCVRMRLRRFRSTSCAGITITMGFGRRRRSGFPFRFLTSFRWRCDATPGSAKSTALCPPEIQVVQSGNQGVQA